MALFISLPLFPAALYGVSKEQTKSQIPIQFLLRGLIPPPLLAELNHQNTIDWLAKDSFKAGARLFIGFLRQKSNALCLESAAKINVWRSERADLNFIALILLSISTGVVKMLPW